MGKADREEKNPDLMSCDLFLEVTAVRGRWMGGDGMRPPKVFCSLGLVSVICGVHCMG